MVNKIAERKNSTSTFISSQEADNKLYGNIQFRHYTLQFTFYSVLVISPEWFNTSKKYEKFITETSITELNSCLKEFYTSARQKVGSYYKKPTIKSIRAAIVRFLK